jgi:hypothetical protein
LSSAVIDAQIDGDVRVGGVKVGNHFFKRGLWAGVQVIEDNSKFASRDAGLVDHATLKIHRVRSTVYSQIGGLI